jgi:cbb3-type cytochrome oxidase subunit 3
MAEDLLSTVVSILAVVVPVFIACILVLITAWVIWFIYRRAKREQSTY